MGEMRCPRDLDETPLGGVAQRVMEPARIGFAGDAVPGAAHDERRRTDEGGIVGERARPGVSDVGRWPGRDKDAGGIAAAAHSIAVEIVLAPKCEMTRQHTTGLALRPVLHEAAPLLGAADKPTIEETTPG